MKHIILVGLGYMGLPTALLIAKAGYKVTGFDVDKKKIEMLSQGKLPFEEAGLLELYAKSKQNFTPSAKIVPGDAYIISVPTPFTDDKKCDNKYVISASGYVASVLREGDLVILESTVTPGTTERIVRPILDKAGKKYLLAYVSEKAIPGNTLHEMQHNHRIIGGYTKEAAEAAKTIYSSFVKSGIHLTDCKTAEMAKLMENTYRDVNIALANEFSKLALEYGVDIWDAISLANLHPRVNIHLPGSGVGGHCIAIDPWFLTENTKSAVLIPAARKINDAQPKYIFDNYIKQNVKKGDKVAILGAAYKKNVDDARESPSLEIIRLCESYGLKVSIHDPYVVRFEYPVEKDLGKSLSGAKLAVIATGHDFYKSADLSKVKVIDCFNLGIKGAVVVGSGKQK